MGAVQEIYRNNATRSRQISNFRSREVISLKHEIEKNSSRHKLSIIAEFKRHSPSGFESTGKEGPVEYFSRLDLDRIAAMSILTEPSGFGGSWSDLSKCQSFNVPLLAKDFFDSESMIHDAYLSGADAVLLISDFLSEERLESLASFAAGKGMDALIEFHDLKTAERIPMLDNVVIGYNRRNLNNMKMEGEEEKVTEMFRQTNAPIILESGIDSRNAVDMDFSAFSGLLIGTSLLKGDKVIEVLSKRGLL